jgi:hypothetical protein
MRDCSFSCWKKYQSKKLSLLSGMEIAPGV